MKEGTSKRNNILYKKTKVLYITNIENPYRNVFFNKLSKKCDLTVLYERKKSSVRNNEWAKSIEGKYKRIYLKRNSF